jgi:hypothetical protein
MLHGRVCVPAVAVAFALACDGGTKPPTYEYIAGTYAGVLSGTAQGIFLQSSFTIRITQDGGTLGGTYLLAGTLSNGVTTLPVEGRGPLAGTIEPGTNPSVSITATSATCPSVSETFSGGYNSTNHVITLTGTVNVVDAACQVVLTYPNTTITLQLGPVQYPLTVSATGTGIGTVTSDPAGINCTSTAGTLSGTCTATYANGTLVTLTATAGTASVFSGWSGTGITCSGTSPCAVTLDQARSVSATFVQHFTLTVSGAGTGIGTVTSDPAGINCTSSGGAPSGTCAANYASGTAVTLTATPATGSVFSGWSGVGITCSGTGPCAVTLDQVRNVTATFVQHLALTVNGAGAGTGTVTSDPAGINCTSVGGAPTGACAATYARGTPVTLTATAATGSVFSAWTGLGITCSGTGPCAVMMDQVRSVTATFVRQFILTVSGAGLGTGTVTSDPVGINCTSISGAPSGTCAATYTSGTTVTLTATPATGSVLSGWTGAGITCLGTAPCAVTIDQARTVTATFGRQAVNLTVQGSGTGAGTVTSVPTGINCTSTAAVPSGTCSASYVSGMAVTLTATPEAGSVFGAWGGDCAGTGSCVVTMTSGRSVTATFVKTFTLAFGVHVSGGGSVRAAPPGVDCRVDQTPCTTTYVDGTAVTLTATPDAGWQFASWAGNIGGCSNAVCTFPMTTDRAAVASFAPQQFGLTVGGAGSGTGTVTSVPTGINCTSTAAVPSGTCAATYGNGTVVELTATPQGGSVFSGWSGECTITGSESCFVFMFAGRSVTATFQKTFTLVYGVHVSGGGTVRATPLPGIPCRAEQSPCTATYVDGTGVTLTATPDAGWQFSSWIGECSGAGAVCTLSMTTDRAAVALFVQQRFALAVGGAGSGTGTVTSAPAGIVCPGDCTESYAYGTSVTLTAVPANGSAFTGWSGTGISCLGTSSCTVTMTQPRTVTATFNPIHTLTVTVAGRGGVESQGILCAPDFGLGDCSESYPEGTAVTLTASPDNGWLFGEWSGDCTGTGDCVVTMTVDRAVAATFVQPPSWIELVTSGGPPDDRQAHSTVYDPSSNVMTIFGGFRSVSGTGVVLDELWVLTNADGTVATPSWTQLFPAGSGPQPCYDHSAVYDGATNRMIVFGCSGNDVWILTNANGTGGTSSWSLSQPLGTPPTSRSGHAAAYDPGTNRMIIFGGATPFASNEVWILTNANGSGGTPTWIRPSIGGLPPTARLQHSVVYDRLSNRMVVFGGYEFTGIAFNDVWVLTNANGVGGTPTWTQPSPTGGPPTARYGHRAVYDPSTNRMVVYGGRNFAGGPFGDVWVLKGANATAGTPGWTEVGIGSPSPTARGWHSAVYDPGSHRMTIFGGLDSFTPRNDVWVLSNANGLP